VYELYVVEMARMRREELLREAGERRLARTLRVGPFGGRDELRDAVSGSEEVRVRWGLAEDEPAVADLLQLNGMPRWVAFEERFIVAERGGKVLGALRYRTESKRLLLGLLVVDPWAGEEGLARALYAGAGDLARGLGVGKVVASVPRANYPGEAGYRRRGRYWRLDTAQARESDGVATGGWRRVLSLFGTLAVPFHRYR
jgi:predicted GNAT family acetyltransferase